MNRRIAASLLAAVVVAGVLTAVVPQHAASISRTLAVAVAVVTGGLLLAAAGPFVAREAPRTELDALPAGGARPLDPHGLRDARRDLDRPAPPGSVPVPVWERLAVASRMRLEAAGIDPDDAASVEACLRSETIRLLATPPGAGFDRDAAAAAAVVHRVLDELAVLDPPMGVIHGHR